MVHKWIQKAVAKGKGALHRALGVAGEKKVPEKKLAMATHSKSAKVRKAVRLAKTLHKLRKKK